MKRIFKITTTALDRAQDRFRRSRLTLGRRGSVLIIVVALLVLMAIIGTAYISTARTDRGAAATNAENTEIGLLLQGVEDMATSQIIADVNPYVTTQTINGSAVTVNATRFRTAGTTYTPYNSSLNDQWLASRVPVGLDTTQAAAFGTANPGVWRFLSYPPTGQFSDPSNSSSFYGSAANAAGGGTYRPDFTTAGGTTYPALYYLSAPATNTWSGPYLAADTDGDGIADAGLFRLPCGEINGVTYYGAYRIVDNAAAINASVAWAPQQITPAAPTIPTGPGQQTLPGNFWPTNVDLSDLLTSPDSLSTTPLGMSTSFNGWRYGTNTPSTTPTETGLGFAFDTSYDTVWNELGRRLQYPASTTYNSLSIADSAAMAHRFVIRDPDASLSNLEQYLPASTLNNALTQAYPSTTAGLTAWFNTNFNYSIGNQANTTSLRSILVGQNPVSNFVSNKYGPAIVALPGANWTVGLKYTFGDWVKNTIGGVTHSYVCIQPNYATPANTPPSMPAVAGSGIPGNYADSAFWVYEPWNNAPVKTSVNTATFGQLWLAYWEVMCDTQNAAPAPQANSSTTVSTTGAMFRSSLRSSTGTPGPALGSALSATQELQLRAAIAATNTLNLRAAGSNFFTSQTAPIYDYTQSPPALIYTAVINGNQPQPYITEVYADNDPSVGDGTTGYIAVEVYNPYPYNIQLTGWAFATVSRPNSAGAYLNPVVIPTTATGWNTSGPIIPANGYAVFANTGTAVPTDFTAGPVATTANDSSPSTSKPPLYVVSDLTLAFNSDLVLMRPPPATAAAAGAPTNITGYFPVDSYDFSGLKSQTAASFNNGTNTYEWHYARPNSLPWEFVYPGPFDQTLGTVGSQPRFKCTQASQSYSALGLSSGAAPPLNGGSVATLGQADAAGTVGSYIPPAPAPQTAPAFPSPAPIIQVDNIDFGGPIKVSSTSTNYFPFGQFPRNGDITQVPFVGSYLLYRGAAVPANLVEMNPITLDSAYAAATGGDQTVSLTGIYTTQHIGRFAPYWSIDYATGNPAGASTAYGWCTRLFDYLTVQAPSDDYTPNADPVGYYNATAGKYSPSPIANVSAKVANAPYTQTATEDTAPVNGLININTASWRVLATLPFSDDPNTNAALAQAIVNYRDGFWSSSNGVYMTGHGPFQNIYDLNNVVSQFNNTQTGLLYSMVPNIYFIKTLGSYYTGTPPSEIYANAYNWLGPSHPPTNNDGQLTPLYSTSSANGWPTTNGITSDFQTQNLALARVSNLITTRSDSYTVYVEVQGWSNAGKANATLVVQRRAAFIVDRSGTTSTNPTVTTTSVSTN